MGVCGKKKWGVKGKENIQKEQHGSPFWSRVVQHFTLDGLETEEYSYDRVIYSRCTVLQQASVLQKLQLHATFF